MSQFGISHLRLDAANSAPKRDCYSVTHCSYSVAGCGYLGLGDDLIVQDECYTLEIFQQVYRSQWGIRCSRLGSTNGASGEGGYSDLRCAYLVAHGSYLITHGGCLIASGDCHNWGKILTRPCHILELVAQDSMQLFATNDLYTSDKKAGQARHVQAAPNCK